MVEFGCKIEEKVKAMQSEIKEIYKEAIVTGRKLLTQINSLDQKEEINIQPKQNEETQIQKTRRGLGTSGTTLNIPTPES